MFSKSFSIVTLMTLLSLMQGCAQTRQTLGMERTQPDEFTTLDRPPLSIPPSLTLKPPVTPGNEDKEGKLNQEKAKQLVLRSGLKTAPSSSSASAELLAKAGVDQRQNNIRETIQQEASVSAPSEEDLAQKILFWQKPKASGDVIDPQVEYQKYKNGSSPSQ